MFLFEYDWSPYLDLSYIDESYDYGDRFNRTARMTEGGIEQYGYIDIKQPPKVKGRKLKSWKKKWVVLHEMSIRSAGRTAAKVDVYTDESTAIRSPADKITFILEYVTVVRAAKSKKHENAFEVVENEPVLLLAGETEYETQTWLTAFKKIFWPDQVENDSFSTTIIQNEHTQRLMLEGTYTMTISPEVISIQSATCNSYEWSLRMLKRFNLDTHEDFPSEQVLKIECGPKSECGEASFLFRAESVAEILEAIKRNIFKAVNMKKSEYSPTTTNKGHTDKQWRTSVTSTTSSDSDRCRSCTIDSEQRYRDLLESPVQDSKRKRLNSESSDMSRRSSDEVSSLPTKKTLSVTFENVDEKPQTVDDILKVDESLTSEEDEYNRVNLKGGRPSGSGSNIITTFTVAKSGYQTKVLLDDKGYSHVGIAVNGPVIEDDKSRSLSNISSHSSVSFRSDSTNSGDSGCLQQGFDKNRPKHCSHKSTNSFDSAVSTSSTFDPNDPSVDKSKYQSAITVEIQELEMTAEELVKVQNVTHDTKQTEKSIYQDVVIEDCDPKSVTKGDKEATTLVKSRSFGDFKAAENHYEELENYRKGKKNLVKHLGMDPKVNPKSIPPALPARPLSHKMKRKFRQNDKRLFTLPFVKNRNKKEKERQRSSSTSSDSDTEEGKSREELSISAWPLGNKSVTIGNNDIYQPVAIQRYLDDEGDNLTPKKRERSSSLNLNTSSQMRRPSEFKGKENVVWKHNRNVSMNLDLFQRNKYGGKMNSNTTFCDRFDNVTFLQTLNSSENLSDQSNMLENTFDDGDEPIYAEVQPICRENTHTVDEPFPDIDSWAPHSPQVTNKCLDDTFYENDSLNKSADVDIFNQGFVTTLETNNDNSTTANLIDLSIDETTEKNENRTSKIAAEIFTLAKDTTLPLNADQSDLPKDRSAELLDLFTLGVMASVPKSTSILSYNTTRKTNVTANLTENSGQMNVTYKELNQSNSTQNESIYMDMSSCKNDSIYVMPSSLRCSKK